MKLRPLLYILVLVLLLSFIIPPSINKLSADKRTTGFAYFRYDFYKGAMFTYNGRVYSDKESTTAVLKHARVRTDPPTIRKMTERDIPSILNFFKANDWEVYSHAMLSVGHERGVPSIHYSFVLRKLY